MARSAWFEIRNPAGELLVSIPARISGGSISAELPVFPESARGSIQLCTDEERTIDRDPPELQDLPTTPQIIVVQLG